MAHKATKISIVTEKLIQDGVIAIIEQAGASGYTVLEGGGKGRHSKRTTDRPSLVSGFGIIKIEVIISERKIADAIAEKIASDYFQQYSGIVYIEEVEVLRPHRF